MVTTITDYGQSYLSQLGQMFMGVNTYTMGANTYTWAQAQNAQRPAARKIIMEAVGGFALLADAPGMDKPALVAKPADPFVELSNHSFHALLDEFKALK